MCNDGAWSDRIPVCRNTSGRGAAFSEELPPRIEVNVVSGHAVEQSGPGGEIFVYPGL